MRRLTIFSFAFLLLFQSGVTAADKGPLKKGYDVYLLIGQSNMAGRGEMLEEDFLPMEGIYLLDTTGKIVPATSPINKYSTIRKDLSLQGYSLGVSFAQAMHERNGRPVLLVVNARGGTAINSWEEGSLYYNEAVRRARQAMRYGKLKAILWHQGESDANEANEATLPLYPSKFKRLAKALRRDLGNVRIIMGEANYSYAKVGLINPELHRAAKKVRRCTIVSAEGCEIKPDHLHFSREGSRILGLRYAEALR
ncbi:MAG: sialate O-acetylesterase [Bacteroidales bacterium]|nr:sialate O-acetylesterase [Bacteroidales bacterium]